MANSERSKQDYYPALLDIAESRSIPDLLSLRSFLENTKGLEHNVNAQNYNGRTVLLEVLSCGYYCGHLMTVTLLRILLEAGADVNLEDRFRRSPLHIAARFSSLGEANREVNTAPFWVEIVTLLVEAGAKVGAVDNEGRTPLHETPDPAVAQYLLDHGGRDCLEMKDKKGNTPLLCCLFSGDVRNMFFGYFPNGPTARIFIQSGADLHTANVEKPAAVDFVDIVLDREIRGGSEGLVSGELYHMSELLMEVVPALHERLGEQSRFDPPSVFGRMLLRVVGEWFESGYSGCEQLHHLIRPLLEKGADVDYVDPKTGFTALHHLLNSCDYDPNPPCDDFFDLALEDESTFFAEDEFEDEEGPSMEDFALEVFNRLHTAKPTLNVGCITNNGWNVLHYAAKAGFTKLAARLLAVARETPQPSALDVSAISSDGLIPLHVACRRGHKEMVRWLVEEGSSVLSTTKATKKREPCTPWEIASEHSLDLLMDLSSEKVRSAMLKQARNTLRECPGLASRVLERLLRSGPAGVSSAFEDLPGIVAPQRQPLKKKLRRCIKEPV